MSATNRYAAPAGTPRLPRHSRGEFQPNLTPHQKRFATRLMRLHPGMMAHYDRVPGFTAKSLTRHRGSMSHRIAVGSASTLETLFWKGWLAVAVEDDTTPVYVLTSEALSRMHRLGWAA